MATIFVTTTARKTKYSPYALSNHRRVLEAAVRDRHKVHSIVENPDEADHVLFVGSTCRFHSDVFANSIYKNDPGKCFVFDFQDNSIPRIPGIYLGIPERLHEVLVYCPGFYPRIFDNKMMQAVDIDEPREYLYSFVGNVENAPSVRSRILNLPSSGAYLCDRSSGQTEGDLNYVQVTAKSKFVLCPRGIGPSSWRLFETMSAGRVPVIVSDSWIPPPGPKWSDFSIRVKEVSIGDIPTILRNRETEAKRMGEAARQQWTEHFGIESAFHWIGNTLEAISRQRVRFQAVINRNPSVELVRSGQVVAYAKSLVRTLLNSRKTN